MMGFLTAEKVMLFSVPLTVALILLEIVFSVKYEREYYNLIDSKQNIFLALCYFIVDVASKGIGLVFLSVFYFYGFNILSNHTNAILYWITLILLQDLSYWLQHFLDHKIRLLWAGHIHHHSSKEFNLSVGLRSAVFEPVERFIFFIPLAIIGFRPIDILLVYVLNQAWGIFVHTRYIKKLGPLEYIFTTPSHHRVHHGRNVKYLDKNFGMFLIIWDKMFGTFQGEDPNEPVDYGLVKNIDYKNYPAIIFNEFAQIFKDLKQKISLKHKLNYLFGSPGYSHDGSRKTAKQLQIEALESAKKRT